MRKLNEQIYSLTIKGGRAVAYQIEDGFGWTHRVIVPMFNSASGNLAPARREYKAPGMKTWTPALNNGWKAIVARVVEALK